MNSSDVPPAPMRTAIALSIVAHLCALLLLAVLLGDRRIDLSSEADSGSTLLVTTLVHHVTTTAPTPRHDTPARRHAFTAATVASATRLVPLARRTAPPVPPAPRAPRVMAAAPAKPAAAPTTRLKLALMLPTRTASATAHRRLASATPAPAGPTPAPATPAPASPAPAGATPTPTAVAANFGGLFSANYPPALTSPGDLAAIRSRLKGPVRIRVDVDETGRASAVHFIEPVSDPALAQEIRATLLALRYVPADCNGLHCEGTLDITY